MKTNLLHLDRCLKRRENQLQVHIFKRMCFIYSDLALIFSTIASFARVISVDHVDSLIFVYHVYEFVRCSNVMKYWEVGFDYVVEFPFNYVPFKV